MSERAQDTAFLPYEHPIVMSADEFAPMLRNLALLYLTMAESADDELSNAELDAVTDNLHQRYAQFDRAQVQDIVFEQLAAFREKEDLLDATRDAVHALQDLLSTEQKKAILHDLVRIARADGVVLDQERGVLVVLSQFWNMDLPYEAFPPISPADQESAADWGVLHNLAFIYLRFAHGTDSDFSGEERHILLNRLRRWDAALDDRRVQAILEQAMARYSEGFDDALLHDAVSALRMTLTEEELRDALQDLVQIANADGFFLDSEEDFINDLMAAWDLDAYSVHGNRENPEG